MSGGQVSGGQVSRGQVSGVRCPGVSCPGVRCHWGSGVHGGQVSLGVKCLRGQVSTCYWGSSVMEVECLRSKIRGQTSGGQVSGGQMSFNPPWSFELREIRVKSF